MQTRPEPYRKQVAAKLFFLALIVSGMAGVFVLNPALSAPSLLAIVSSMLLSPAVAALERRGWSRAGAIAAVFAVIGVALGFLGAWAAHSFQDQVLSFREKAPEYFEATIRGLRALETDLQARYPALGSLHPTDSVVAWGESTSRWFAVNGATWASSLLTWILLVPPLTFVLLNDGRTLRRRFFDLVPNRHFESFFLVSTQIVNAISDYLRAKLIEALLVGAMTTVGLLLVHAPYAALLGFVAGLTNILPYIGPIIGLVPALVIALFDGSGHGLLWPVLVVYLVANVIDMVVIFPIVVAKLVNLHPLLLIAVVAVGQQYYGLVGMLISIPVASACKVIVIEIHSAIYERPTAHRELHAEIDQEEAA
jgi:putative permease